MGGRSETEFEFGYLVGGFFPLHEHVGSAVVGQHQATQLVGHRQYRLTVARRDVAQYGIDLVFQNKLARQLYLGFGTTGFVQTLQFDLAAQNTAFLVIDIGHHLVGIVARDAKRTCGRAG